MSRRATRRATSSSPWWTARNRSGLVAQGSDNSERRGLFDASSLGGVGGGADDQRLFEAFLNYLRTDSRFYHTSAADLLAGYRDICKQVDPWLPRLFGRLPRLRDTAA